jgi:hypothetical protein
MMDNVLINVREMLSKPRDKLDKSHNSFLQKKKRKRERSAEKAMHSKHSKFSSLRGELLIFGPRTKKFQVNVRELAEFCGCDIDTYCWPLLVTKMEDPDKLMSICPDQCDCGHETIHARKHSFPAGLKHKIQDSGLIKRFQSTKQM